ncbi:MAG: hypothetical protein B6241_01285 [Spirochaetaceae bacterium 4572_59]|nr:MAG: hypothetical protein B6241_01285 [Spirochaetaceae bacterium 4572_59]
MENKKIIVPTVSNHYLNLLDPEELESFNSHFDQLGRPCAVDKRSWMDYPERPEVSVRIASSDEYLFVKFHIREREVLGRFKKDNEPVYLDSCVEIFLSPQGSNYYYNFEFNCLGTCLAQVGTDRNNREYIGSEILEGISRIPSLGQQSCCIYSEGVLEEAKPWSLLVAIPVQCFVRDDFETLSGQKFRGNFYKCGDDLSLPHYLSWNKIETEYPDFHRPEFFGEIWIS